MNSVATAIQTSKLSVTKDKNQILTGVSFSVTHGLIVGLIGPSGSGKTTLMRTIVGLQIPTKGIVKVDGLLAGDKRLRSRIGYVTQSPSIYNDLTVEQNIDYFAQLLGTDSRDVARVIHEVDLVKQKNQLATSLSGGQKARVSLAIALLGDPDILVLDEPTVGLDPVLRQKLWGLFRHLAKQGKSLLVSSHVMDEADRCDDVILMREGKILWNGTRKDLLKKAHARSVESAFLSLVEGK
jgi:ABC-2 type transport system ATP-binding protein